VIPRLLASTTSHKAEPLLPTLEVFSRLGLRDVDLNLHHIIEGGVPVEAIEQQVAASGLRVWGLAGGWCDFFHAPPRIDETFRSVAFQVSVAERLGVSLVRLFFGRLPFEECTADARDRAARNLQDLSVRHPGILFVLENHDGASQRPDVCRGSSTARTGPISR
jgi:sugar phosphate isomerase/epimerase